ncbi:MAG: Lrp/AsnC family transcriptional regulator [Lentisphaeria bacterium]|nr:Lrp/AsnC family transcriptional regulator [Lentisphaeria bacterium]
MQQKILSLLKENARIGLDVISRRTGLDEAAAAAEIKKLEESGIIRGYTAILNENADNSPRVKAVIEVKVTPKREGGFDQVARRIANYPEVTDLMLISGSFDLLLTVQGSSLNEVANFVAAKLATIDGVISTSTGFMLKKYKESGRVMEDNDEYERLKICP